MSNQMHTTSGPDYLYDAAGNMTHDATTGLNYSYDPENRITGAAGYTYTYDADGNRVEKSNGTTGTIYWYMSPGIVAESDLTGALKSEYVFFDGERIARKDFPGNSVSYYFSDELKTADFITDPAGNIKSDSDYYPFGGELSLLNGDSNHYKHNGKERDAETGLDYYGARYYSPSFSRFLTPDWSSTPVPVPYADLANPQTLNQYIFAHNNPASLDDDDGHDPGGVAQVVQVVSTTSEEVPVAIEPVIPSLGALGPLLGGAVFRRVDPKTDPPPKWIADAAELASQRTGQSASEPVGALAAGSALAGVTGEEGKEAEPAPASGGAMRGSGRGGKQARLRELGKDDKVSSADRGEIRRDQNEIARGRRTNIRVPGKKDLAHRRGKEAKKGYNYSHADLQNKDLHRLQHKHEGYK